MRQPPIPAMTQRHVGVVRAIAQGGKPVGAESRRLVLEIGAFLEASLTSGGTRGTEGRAANQYDDIARDSMIEVDEQDVTLGDPDGRATRLTIYAENGIEHPFDVAYVRLAPEVAAALGRRLANGSTVARRLRPNEESK